MKKYSIIAALIFFITGLFYYFFIQLPDLYPVNTLVNIPKDISTEDIGELLKEKHIIRSPLVFESFIKSFGNDRKIQAGNYFIKEGENVFKIADRMLKGEKEIPYKKITFPEGSSVTDMAYILLKQDNTFDSQLFIKKALPYEGYLFPDTYLIPIDFTIEKTIELLRNTFERKTADLPAFSRPLGDIIKMAAVLEEEGNAEENRRMISDILWRRIAIGMPLQVDVYRPSYKTKGLPPAPISNPGLQSIKAAITPLQNPYLYYITGNDGKFYYAKTYAEHIKNINAYLKTN